MIELDQRLVIIKNSPIDDVIILDENYKHLMREAITPEDKKSFEILHSFAKERIRELSKNDK